MTVPKGPGLPESEVPFSASLVPAQAKAARRGWTESWHLSPSPGPSPSWAPGQLMPLTGPHFLGNWCWKRPPLSGQALPWALVAQDLTTAGGHRGIF